MTKVVVTGEMAAKALETYKAYEPCVARKIDAMYAALEAALNPPPEPEIVVTDEMEQDGVYAYSSSMMSSRESDHSHELALAAAYRAMRRLAPDFNKGPEAKPAAEDLPVQTGPVQFAYQYLQKEAEKSNKANPANAPYGFEYNCQHSIDYSNDTCRFCGKEYSWHKK